MKPTILIATDHAGFELKNLLIEHIKAEGYKVEDMSGEPHNDIENIEDRDDYPRIMAPVGQKVSEAPETYKAIIIGGSGQGEAMVVNRFPNVRACVYYGGRMDMIVELSRTHNDANILSLGARFITDEEAKEMGIIVATDSFFRRSKTRTAYKHDR